jgi:hypothetical protein
MARMKNSAAFADANAGDWSAGGEGQYSSAARRGFRPWQVWAMLTLAWKFLLAGTIVLVIGMTIIAIWVTSEIEDGVIENSATTTALYVDSVISPLLADLHDEGVLTPGAAGLRRKCD